MFYLRIFFFLTNVSILNVFRMLISSYRSRKFGGACGTRNFSESEGAVLFYINKSLKKKKEKEKREKGNSCIQ